MPTDWKNYMMVLTILQNLLQIGVLIYSSFLINKSLAKKTPKQTSPPPPKISGGRKGVMPTPLTSLPLSFFLYVRKDIYSYSLISCACVLICTLSLWFFLTKKDVDNCVDNKCMEIPLLVWVGINGGLVFVASVLTAVFEVKLSAHAIIFKFHLV